MPHSGEYQLKEDNALVTAIFSKTRATGSLCNLDRGKLSFMTCDLCVQEQRQRNVPS